GAMPAMGVPAVQVPLPPRRTSRPPSRATWIVVMRRLLQPPPGSPARDVKDLCGHVVYNKQPMTRTVRPGSRSRWLALLVLCAGMLMIVLDATIVNVALPSIQRDLRFSQSSLAWVVNAYLIPFGGLLLLAGRLG